MSTSASRTLAAHPRQTWRTFLGASVLGLAAALVIALALGAGRVGITLTVSTGVVVIGALAAVLDAIVTPGNPDVLRHRGGGHHADLGMVGHGGADCGGGGDCG